MDFANINKRIWKVQSKLQGDCNSRELHRQNNKEMKEYIESNYAVLDGLKRKIDQ